MQSTYVCQHRHIADVSCAGGGAASVRKAGIGEDTDRALGTGTPSPDADRSGPATAIVVNSTAYLIDFGPGVVRRIAAASQKGVAGLGVVDVRVAFVTHLHSDHTAGYADLILTPWSVGRSRPLEVYGPKGLEHMTDHIVEAYKEDTRFGEGTSKVLGVPERADGYKANVHARTPISAVRNLYTNFGQPVLAA